MIHEFRRPMPVVTPMGDGYAIYVESGGMYENDVWTVCLSDGGRVLHFNSDQIKVWHNETFGIKKGDEKTEEV
jgi:hypothetical protein